MSNGKLIVGTYSSSTDIYANTAIMYPNGSNGSPNTSPTPPPLAAEKTSPIFVIDVTNL
jgi:hypothetical protein